MSLKPLWDQEKRVLSFGPTIVKRYKVSSQYQITILCVFQEMGWPMRIDDPLPVNQEIDAKQRLDDTIKGLNRTHINPNVLTFCGDEDERGICWRAEQS